MIDDLSNEPPVDAPTADPVGGYVLGEQIEYWTLPLEKRPFLFRHMDELVPYRTRIIRHGAWVRPLPEGGAVDVDIVLDGHRETIDSFMHRYHTAALMVVKDGQVVAERYRYGNTRNSRWVMFSVTKSILSVALMNAVAAGCIRTIDELVTAYVPALLGGPYEHVSIRDAMNMASGLDRADVYEGTNPRSNPQELAYFSEDPEAVHRYIASHGRFAKPGDNFNYNNMDSFVLGEVLAAAVSKPVADWISETIWVPGGMEDDAYMRCTAAGQEVSHGGLSATLRDIARFGLLTMDHCQAVRLQNDQLGPASLLKLVSEAEPGPDGVRAPGHNTVVPDFGYALHWWTMPRGRDRYELGDDGGFAALGLYGQQLYVVPNCRLVVVLQSADLVGVNSDLFLRGRDLATAIAEQLGR